MKHGKLLIAMDGSPNSKDAVKYVTQICTPGRFKITLLHVMPTAPESFWDMNKDEFFKKKMKGKYDLWRDNSKEVARRFLGEAKNDLVRMKFPEHHVDMVLRERRVGIARDILVEVTQGYDALVVGRRGFSKLESLFLGSIADRIVETIRDIPVWVVGGKIRSNNMLVAVDASENSRRAVEYLGEVVGATETQLTLFHVVHSFGLGFLEDFTLVEEEIEGFVEEMESNLPRMFRSYKELLVKAGVLPRSITTEYDMQSYSRAGSILRESEERNFGTIVMGRRGLSEVHEFSMGRVTKNVLNRAGGFAVWIVP